MPGGWSAGILITDAELDSRGRVLAFFRRCVVRPPRFAPLLMQVRGVVEGDRLSPATQRGATRCGSLESGLPTHQPVAVSRRAGKPAIHLLQAAGSVLNTETAREARHEGKEAGDQRRRKYLLFRQASFTQVFDIALFHRVRVNGEFARVVQHGPGFGVQVHRAVVVHYVAGVAGVAGLLTEEPSVGDGSVAALVDHRDGRRYGLFLHRGQCRASERKLLVELPDGLHCGRVDRYHRRRARPEVFMLYPGHVAAFHKSWRSRESSSGKLTRRS